MSNYTTGEMAKLCNVSVRTVQYYDTKGILPPSELTEGGRRIYNDHDLEQLRLICTLKAIGLSLGAIKSIMESELSGKIFTLLLDEQVQLLTGEIAQRQKQLDMIQVLQEKVHSQATVPVNTILDIEDAMEKKREARNMEKLAMIYVGVGVFVTTQLLLLGWLVWTQRWWAVGLFGLSAVFGIGVSVLQLKNTVFICPKCDGEFKPPLARKFFTTGNHKVRYTTCPLCEHKGWCVLRSQGQEYQTN